ncbi:hypothetical protein [Streptomyces sp. NPDC047928]|uniref:hypothetical protein n=1 Tax=unclassified Streptomyces TaxID=2593676 RepID=UPI00371F729E
MEARAADRLRMAEETVARLRGELGAAGVVLPSLRVDPVTATGEEPYPLVELGRCNLDTALRLAAVLHEARR